jgi:hypothetical protein
MAWAHQASDQEIFHAGEQKNQENDGDLREAQEIGVGFLVRCVVHGRMALRNIDTHVFFSPYVAFEILELVGILRLA